MKYAVPLIIFLWIVLLLARGLGQDDKDKKVLTNSIVGKHTPSFVLPDLLALKNKVSTQQFKGQVTVINFWAEWCLACKHEMPVLNRFTSMAGVKLYGVNFRDDYDAALRMLKQFGNPYRATAYDKEGVTGIDFGITALPETFILDKQGKIVHRHIGPVTEAHLPTLMAIIKKYSQ